MTNKTNSLVSTTQGTAVRLHLRFTLCSQDTPVLVLGGQPLGAAVRTGERRFDRLAMVFLMLRHIRQGFYQWCQMCFTETTGVSVPGPRP